VPQAEPGEQEQDRRTGEGGDGGEAGDGPDGGEGVAVEEQATQVSPMKSVWRS